MDNIRAMAVLSVRRGCGFAGLAIATMMFGLISDIVLSFRTGAVLTTLAAVVLFWKAYEAPRRDYRRTELWIMLEHTPDVPAANAGRVINGVLQEVYRSHAEAAAAIAFLLWLVAIGLQLL
jgi:hypothetical protein